MRKNTIIAVLILVSAILTQAQTRNVVSAYNYLRRGDLTKAKEYIDKAAAHKRTINDAKTWYYNGNVYLSLHLAEDYLHINLTKSPLEIAYKSYKKALDLDDKNKYTKDLKTRMKYISEQYFNVGTEYYKEEFYENASIAFETAYQISNKYTYKDDIEALYYTANSADSAGNFERAVKFYEKAKKGGYGNEKIDESLQRLYGSHGKTIKTEGMKTNNNGGS